MRVVKNNQTFSVGWRYENPKLVELLEHVGLTESDAEEMSFAELCEALGMNALPDPAVTHCIIKNEEGEEIARATVKKWKHDRFMKSKARNFSLTKALRNLFPGEENSGTRKLFWDVYLKRKDPRKSYRDLRTQNKVLSQELAVLKTQLQEAQGKIHELAHETVEA